MVPYFNDASELFITRDLEIGDRYSVFAPIFEGGNAGLNKLVNAAAGTEDKYYETFYDLYTQLPNHLEQKLFDDVFNTIQNAETPYDQALTLMNYLKKYYRYTLTPKAPPENLDFITYFLYIGKEGYCTYFASAMTVMCRIAGLPARYVEGFLAYPSSDGFAYVTGLTPTHGRRFISRDSVGYRSMRRPVNTKMTKHHQTRTPNPHRRLNRIRTATHRRRRPHPDPRIIPKIKPPTEAFSDRTGTSRNHPNSRRSTNNNPFPWWMSDS